jgi:hypothetical protein
MWHPAYATPDAPRSKNRVSINNNMAISVKKFYDALKAYCLPMLYQNNSMVAR